MIWVAPNTTVCADTPENWARFEAIKADLIKHNGRIASAGFESTYSPPEVTNKPNKKASAQRGPVIMYGLNTCKG